MDQSEVFARKLNGFATFLKESLGDQVAFQMLGTTALVPKTEETRGDLSDDEWRMFGIYIALRLADIPLSEEVRAWIKVKDDAEAEAACVRIEEMIATEHPGIMKAFEGVFERGQSIWRARSEFHQEGKP
jgi:hypothetical protein